MSRNTIKRSGTGMPLLVYGSSAPALVSVNTSKAQDVAMHQVSSANKTEEEGKKDCKVS
jgi:hypothetical protein